MCDTYSQIFSAAYLSLGQPEDSFLSRLELANIVSRRWSYRMEGVRQSEQSVILAKSSTFTLAANENEENLTTLESDFSIPMWVEQQVTTYNSEPVWRFVPTVNLNILQQFRMNGTPAVAFYGANPLQVIAQFSYYGQDLWGNMRTHRVWYLPTLTAPTTEDTQIQLPDNLVNMLVYDTIDSAIPIIQMNMAKQLKDRPELSTQMDALKALYMQNKQERDEFAVYFEKWMNESRGSHRPRRRNEVLKNMQGIIRTTWQSGN